MLMMECALGNGSDFVGDWKNQDYISGAFFFFVCFLGMGVMPDGYPDKYYKTFLFLLWVHS